MHTNWSQFFGRFHPLWVHLPIGFLLFAAILSVIALFKKNAFLSNTINIALLAGAIGAVGACISGWMLSAAGGYDQKELSLHKWIGISVAIISFLIWLARSRKGASKSFLRLTITTWLIFLCISLMAFGAHLGGNLTHGEGYLTKYMPAGLKNILGVTRKTGEKKILPVLDSVIVYRDIIQPMLDVKCISCHNPNKTNGDLDLSTLDGIMKGGKSGNTVVAGNTEKSELYHRITLPVVSAKFMPADNQPSLTPIEINFMRWWIQNGAVSKKSIQAMEVDEKTKFLIAAYLGIDVESNKQIVLPQIAAADSIAIKQLNSMNLVLRPVTNSSNLLTASFVMLQGSRPEIIQKVLEKLAAIKDQVYELDISNCNLNSDMIRMIGTFSRLNKLDLQQNHLTDDQIEGLSNLQNLKVLNAGQNDFTDKCITTFKKITGLKKINLWQTKITPIAGKGLSAEVVM